MNKFRKYLNDVVNLTKNFGFVFAIQCVIRRIISFSSYENFIYRYLVNFFLPLIHQVRYKNMLSIDSENKLPNKVWTLWWQGEEQMPELVKVCIESQKKAFQSLDTEVIVLNKYNWEQYISLPQHIITKVQLGKITLTHLSDIIRTELLKCHGGIWIDATVFCTKPIAKTIFDGTLFTIKCHKESESLTLKRWTGFLFGGKQGFELFCFMSKAFDYYWSAKDALAAYLLIDYIIAIACDFYPQVNKELERIPVSNVHLWSMLKKLNEEYNDDEWNYIIQDTTFLKLSYKDEFNGGSLRKETETGNLTYWGKISENFL